MPFPSPGDLHNPATEPATPALGVGYFTTEPSGKTSSSSSHKHPRFAQIDEPSSGAHLSEWGGLGVGQSLGGGGCHGSW